MTSPLKPRRPIFGKLATPNEVANLFPGSPELVFGQDTPQAPSLMLPIGDQSAGAVRASESWLGSQKPAAQAADDTDVARVEKQITPPPKKKTYTPEEQTAARARGTSTFGRQVSLKDAIQSTLQGHPSSQQVADLQAEARGEEVVRPDATKGESFMQGFRRGIPVPLIGGDMGATNPDFASEMAGGAAAFLPQQVIAGPLVEGNAIERGGTWLASQGASAPFRAVAREALEGGTVSALQEARAVSNQEETVPEAGANIAAGAALGIPLGGAIHGAGKLVRTGAKWLGREIADVAPSVARSLPDQLHDPLSHLEGSPDYITHGIAQMRAATDAFQAAEDAKVIDQVTQPHDISHYSDQDLHDELGKTEVARRRFQSDDPADANGRADSQVEAAFLERYHQDLDAEITRRAHTENHPNEIVRSAANEYNESHGLGTIEQHHAVPHDEALSREISDWYESAKSDPNDARTKAAYEAFNREVDDQYNHLVEKGWQFSRADDPVHDTYSSAAEMRDAAARKRLKVFTGGTPNPLMTPEQNFRFRAVHDVMAHTGEGYDFSPPGEHNAALKHGQMFTPLAKEALYTETVGQNSNLNYGKNGEHNRANMGKEIFPEQKAVTMPLRFVEKLEAQRDAALVNPKKPGTVEAFKKVKELGLEDAVRHEASMRSGDAIDTELAARTVLDEHKNLIRQGLTTEGATKTLNTQAKAFADAAKEKLDLWEAQADARLKQRRAGRLMSGFDPADIKDEAIKAAVHIARGTLDFAQWSGKMLDQFGDSVKPHLEKIWAAAEKNLASFRRAIKRTDGKFPSQKELNKTFARGVAQGGHTFYDQTAEGLQQIFGKFSEVASKALASTSPNTLLVSNATLALKGMKFNWEGLKLKKGFIGVHKQLLTKVFAGEAEFGGLKVKDFALAMTQGVDAEQAVVADVWMGRIFFGKDKLSDNQYLFIRHFVRNLADEWGVTPRQAQAGLWYGIKEAVEGPGDMAFFPELIRNKLGQGYLDDLLQKKLNDPDFAPLRNARDEETKKRLAGKRNAAFMDKLRFQDPKTNPMVTGEHYAILTWANPHGKKYGKAYNDKQNGILIRELRRLGYEPIKQDGVYGHPEPSLLVPGLSAREAIDLSRAGGQDAYISHEGYVDLKAKTVAPITGIEFDNNAKDYYSSIRLGGAKDTPIKYQLQVDFDNAKKLPGHLDLPPSLEQMAYESLNPKANLKPGVKRALAIGAPAPFYAAAEMEQDPEKKEKLLGVAKILTVIAVGATIPKEQADIFITAMRSKLGDLLNGGEIPANLGDYAGRRYWESRLGKLDDLTWARMKQTADRSLGEKLDPLGKAYTGEGDKQYLNHAYLMQDPDGKQFIDARVKHWESQGLRPIVISDATTRTIADMLDVGAEDLSRSSLKSMTAPEILAVHDLMESSKEAVQQISKFIDQTPGLVKEQLDELEDIMAKHVSRFDAASLKIFEVRSEAGRSLRQFRLIGDMVNTPGFWVHQAAKKLGVRMSEVPATVARDIQHFMAHGEFPQDSKIAQKFAAGEARAAKKAARALESEAARVEKQLTGQTAPRKPRTPKLGSAENDITAYIRNAAGEARARIKARSGTLYSGLDPQVLADYTILGVELIHDGIVKTADFITRLKADTGEISDQDALQVYVAAGKRHRELQRGKGRVSGKGGAEIVAPGGSQEVKPTPGPRLEPNSVNLDRPTKSQRVETLGTEGVEKSPEGVSLEPQPVQEPLKSDLQVKTSTQDKLPPEPAQGPGLTGKAGVANKFENVIKTLTPEEQARLVHYVNKLAPNKRLKGWLNAWKAGLLTNPLTHKVNLTGNIAHQGLIAARNNIATGFDVMFAAGRASFDREGKPWTQAYWDNRTRVFGLQQYKAQAVGAVEGTKKGWYYMTTGFDQDDILSGLKAENARTGVYPVDLATDVIFRTLGAEDKVFRYAALRGSIAEQAMLQASRERLSGSAWRNRVHEISVNPTVLGEEEAKRMLMTAAEDASFAVFQDQTQLNKTLGAIVRNHPFMEAIVPFRKTVASIATKGLVDYNPIGATLQIARLAKMGELNQKKLTELLAGGTVGAAAMWAGYTLASEGKATSSYPRDATERNLWAEENKQENSFLSDGRWRDYGKLPGLGPMMSMGAALYEYQQKNPEGNLAMGVGVSMLKGAKTTLDQNFLQGTNQALKAMDDPDGMLPGLAKNYARSVVPAVVGAIARGTDPKSREVVTPLDAVKAAIPGKYGSQSLPEKRTPLDFPIEREGGVIGQTLGIGKSPTARQDVLVQELRRLQYHPGKPGKAGKYGDSERKRSKEEYSLFTKAAGEKTRLGLYELLDSKEYQDAEDDEAKKELIHDVVQEAREETQDEEQDQKDRNDRVMEGKKVPAKSLKQSNEKLTYKPLRDIYRSHYAETK